MAIKKYLIHTNHMTRVGIVLKAQRLKQIMKYHKGRYIFMGRGDYEMPRISQLGNDTKIEVKGNEVFIKIQIVFIS